MVQQISLIDKERIISVDVLRGAVIFLMIFVNTHVPNAPWWLEHFPKDQSGMTFADVIFPAFLFLMGVSIPLSIGKRLRRKAAIIPLLGNVLLRSTSLILMGLLKGNMNRPSPEQMFGWGLSSGFCMFIVLVLVVLVWHDIRTNDPKIKKISCIVRVLSAGILLVYIVCYRNEDGQWFKTAWWGILGILGWSYLIGVFIYLFLRDHRDLLLLASFALIALYIGMENGIFSGFWFNQYIINPNSSGSLMGGRPSITVMGIAVGTLLISSLSHKSRLSWMFRFTLITALIACFFEPLYGISKIKSTPTWIYASVSITVAAWISLYWLIEIKEYKSFPVQFFKTLGAVPLTAYILSYVIANLRKITINDWFRDIGSVNLFTGVLCAFGSTILICWLTNVLWERTHFRVKL